MQSVYCTQYSIFLLNFWRYWLNFQSGIFGQSGPKSMPLQFMLTLNQRWCIRHPRTVNKWKLVLPVWCLGERRPTSCPTSCLIMISPWKSYISKIKNLMYSNNQDWWDMNKFRSWPWNSRRGKSWLILSRGYHLLRQSFLAWALKCLNTSPIHKFVIGPSELIIVRKYFRSTGSGE